METHPAIRDGSVVDKADVFFLLRCDFCLNNWPVFVMLLCCRVVVWDLSQEF